MPKIAPNPAQMRAVRGNIASPPAPANTISVLDVGWMHAELEWVYEGGKWNDPCVLQRKTSGSFSTPDLTAAQDPDTNFIWVGIRKANRYTDLGLTSDTTYNYRVAYVTNWSDVVLSGDTPAYSTWQYGEVTTDVKPGSAPALPYPMFEGWAAYVSGGRGGTVIHVTNLNASGAGSFKAAAESSGTRTIVFDVGGVIDMNGAQILINDSNFSIYGQTAPSPGITIIDGNIKIEDADNGIIQHIKVRVGAARHMAAFPGTAWERDAIWIFNCTNIVVDHCSLSWATDENISITNDYFTGLSTSQSTMLDEATYNVTLSNNIISEGLADATNSAGEHSKASLTAPGTNRLLYTKNLFAHNDERSPQWATSTNGAMINNAIYNPQDRPVMAYGNNVPSGSDFPPTQKISFLGNLYKLGPNSQGAQSLRKMVEVRMYNGSSYIEDAFPPATYGYSAELYFSDNIRYNKTGAVDASILESETTYQTSSANWVVGTPSITAPYVTVLAASEVNAYLQANVGSLPWDRDAIDSRVISEWQNNTGSIPDLETDKEGFPNPTPTSHPSGYDTSGDGMPDTWKTAKGLDPDLAEANGFDLHANYTNLEVYVHEVSLGISESSSSVVYNIVDDYGADNTGATNNWSAFTSARLDMIANGGVSELYIPAGTYLIYPIDSDVTFDGTYLKAVQGDSFSTAFLTGDLSNCIIRGDVDGDGNPSTFLNMRLWHNRPGTEYLTVLKTSGGNPAVDADIYQGPSGNDPTYGIKRYSFLTLVDGMENIELRNLDIDMTATPVSTGKAWYTFSDLRTQWDISQKLVRGNDISARNILLKNVVAKNIRGEIAYWGGVDKSCEKYKMEDCVFSRSNSSITSMGAQAEYVNCTFSDFSNSGIENAPHAKDGDATGSQLISPFTGLPFYQDTIVRGCTIEPLPSAGIMQGLSDLATADNAFSGIHIFNQSGTLQTVTDTTIKNFRDLALGPWYECENLFYDNLTIQNPLKTDESVIWFDPKSATTGDATDYKLSGGMDYVYMSNIAITMGSNGLGNAGSFFRNFTSLQCQNNVIIDKLTLDGNSQTISRIWTDKYTNATGRSLFQLRDWTSSNLTTDAANFFVNLNTDDNTLPIPYFEDFAFEWHLIDSSSPTVVWGQTQIYGTRTISSIPNIGKHTVNSILKFKSASGTQTWPANSGWNTFTQSYAVSGSLVLTCKVVLSGTRKLQFVSLA